MTDTYPAPLHDDALDATWQATWSSLGRPAPADLRAELLSAWSEPHRHCHDQRHLRESLALWARWQSHCERPGEVALALWFHDAVYDPRDSHHELNSAAWAARAMTTAGADSATTQRVHDLVMATRHRTPQDRVPVTPVSGADAELVADIDLSILGSPAERFERYDQDMRKEHTRVPGLRYQGARARTLQGFLDRPRLYHRDAPFALLETQARFNLTAALSRLAQ